MTAAVIQSIEPVVSQGAGNRAPDVAETVEWNDLVLEVADMDEHRIDKVLVRFRNEAAV